MDKLAEKFSALADQYGPAVADAAKAAARMEAYSCLVGGTVAMVVGMLFLFVAWRLWKSEDRDTDEFFIIGAVICCIIGAIPFVAGLCQWLDPWTWATISHPELWIAKKAFGL